MKTFGEFFDLVKTWADGPDGSAEAGVALKDWSEMDSGVSWADTRAIPLSEDYVLPLADDMQTEFADIIRGTCGDDLYAKRIRRGHDLLRAIARIAREQGVNVSDDDVNCPLTPTELLVAIQTRPST